MELDIGEIYLIKLIQDQHHIDFNFESNKNKQNFIKIINFIIDVDPYFIYIYYYDYNMEKKHKKEFARERFQNLNIIKINEQFVVTFFKCKIIKF